MYTPSITELAERITRKCGVLSQGPQKGLHGEKDKGG